MNTTLRIDIESVLCTDNVAIDKLRAKINQWITKGELKKYDIHTTSTHVIFNICRISPSKVEKSVKLIEEKSINEL